ncbi:hypothetical protein M409DRAFT_70716 [Zasmidium cellare ATCC 36951]|uniref:Major facilitator superfamily (MFS) profile domain-containing protein n=1 Tax=Zasmidium cellare ATCC 36951 TaxID=1080233 RepID=A0A6A6BZF9_ZASCE|nr:uncharacterized protein M409DRAFT_70716 [Zasmidium cellare ATCC 36951]KAF2159993.1 hypothetical protein M409DRAFT_70716 [Zasmidium cellare ATCC 36951]
MASPTEKIKVHHVENLGVSSRIHSESSSDHTGLDEKNTPDYRDPEVKRICRKIDWHLPPVLALLYLLSFLDRTNIGNAKIAGMTKDLHMTGSHFNIALTVFFFPYALFMIPSNMVLKKGTVMTMHGVVQSYGQLCAVRALLGLCEAGFTPAASYLLSCWYARFELQTRMALFFSAATLAGAFSGILAYAIQHMEGTAGYEGWRWIFILEGIATVAVGMSVFWILPNSPATCRFLTDREKAIIERRLAEDAGTTDGHVASDDKFQWSSLFSILTDWKIWLWGVVVCGQSIPFYAFNFFSPTIVKELGYKSWQAQLMVVPIYAVACIATVLFGIFADWRQRRWIYICVPYAIAAVGFVALLAIPHPKMPGVTYFFLFFIPLGLSTGVVGLLAWVANNLAPSWRKSIGIAFVACLANLGGSIGSNIYLEEEKPRYWLGFGFSLGVLSAAIVACVLLKVLLTRVNRRREAMDVEEIKRLWSEEQLLAMGDRSPLYRYVT